MQVKNKSTSRCSNYLVTFQIQLAEKNLESLWQTDYYLFLISLSAT